MKEQRRGPLARVGDIAETLAAGAKRRQQAREPRVLLYDEAGEPRVHAGHPAVGVQQDTGPDVSR